MSHEIRTPMNAVLGLLELELRSPGDRAATERALTTAHQAARDLLSIIDDILDIAKIEAERLVLTPAPLEIGAWVQGVVAIYEPAARGKGVALTVREAEGDGHGWVEADALRLRQVLGNLLSNAIKFTDRGAVALDYALAPPQDGRRELTLSVTDTGIGIAADQQGALFSPFVQVHDERARRFGGTGLGLTICRRLVTMMGGTITLVSEPGKGSCFTVRIALQASVAVAAPPEASTAPGAAVVSALAGLRILVVDDHPANRMLLKSQLGLLGCRVETAVDGQAGLARWQRNEGGYDLILTDCSMPVMSGGDLARSIRRAEAEAHVTRAIAIVGLTANAQPEAAARAIDAGMNACLVKPLGLDDLYRAISIAAPGVAPPVSGQPAPLPFDAALMAGLGPHAVTLVDVLQTANAHDLAEARRALGEHDYAGLLDTAHRVKGAAHVVGAVPLAQACHALERACHDAIRAHRQGMPDRRVEAAFGHFIEEADALGAALERRPA